MIDGTRKHRYENVFAVQMHTALPIKFTRVASRGVLIRYIVIFLLKHRVDGRIWVTIFALRTRHKYTA